MFSEHVRHVMLQFAAGAVVCSGLPVGAQDAKQDVPPDVGVVLKIQTNEVVLDVVARDRRGNPVNDLKQEEFEVFEVGKRADKGPHRILSMRTIDPHRDESRTGRAESGFKISSGAVCALRMVTHYELAIPAAQEPGYHQVVIKTNRKDVTFSYRHRYYVAPMPSGALASSEAASKGHKVTGDDTAWRGCLLPSAGADDAGDYRASIVCDRRRHDAVPGGCPSGVAGRHRPDGPGHKGQAGLWDMHVRRERADSWIHEIAG
jgi:hypothetical protein